MLSFMLVHLERDIKKAEKVLELDVRASFQG